MDGSITADIYGWDIDYNKTTREYTFDQYEGKGSSALTITTGEFRVLLGGGVNLGDAFWDSVQLWYLVIKKASGSTATIPTLTTGVVAAYLATDPLYGLVDTSAEGTFSLQGDSTDGYTVKWDPDDGSVIAIPEPSTALVGLLLGAGLLRRRRGRRGSGMTSTCAGRLYRVPGENRGSLQRSR